MHPDRLRALFLAEGRECAASLDAALLVLDRAPADADARERAFRALHTLKGMGATLALDALTAVVHAGEALLAAARARGGVDAAWHAPLAALLATVQRALDDFERGAALDDAAMTAQAATLRGLLDLPAMATAAPSIAHMPTRDDSLAPPPGRESSAAAAPVRTARIPVERLDALLDLAGDLLIARDRLLDLLPDGTAASAPAALARREAADTLARTVDRMRDAVITARLVPVSHVLDRFPRHVRDTAHALGKDVDLVIEGRDLEVDRSILDELGEPLVHLVRNALDHGLERPDVRRRAGKTPVGRLVIRVAREGDRLAVTVADDGRGMDRGRLAAGARALGVPDADVLAATDDGLLRLAAHPGLSTASEVTALSGRGTGMDAVLARVRAVGGRAALATTAGQGTAITLHVPMSVAIVRALLVRAGDATWAIPVHACMETRRLDHGDADADAPTPRYRVDDVDLPLVSLRRHLGLPPATAPGHVVIVRGAHGPTALQVDACLAQRDVVVKPLPRVRGADPVAGGATLLGDGTPALLLDPAAL